MVPDCLPSMVVYELYKGDCTTARLEDVRSQDRNADLNVRHRLW
jgi:hypothetical protein